VPLFFRQQFHNIPLYLPTLIIQPLNLLTNTLRLIPPLRTSPLPLPRPSTRIRELFIRTTPPGRNHPIDDRTSDLVILVTVAEVFVLARVDAEPLVGCEVAAVDGLAEHDLRLVFGGEVGLGPGAVDDCFG
jgi:hypothetical protein